MFIVASVYRNYSKETGLDTQKLKELLKIFFCPEPLITNLISEEKDIDSLDFLCAINILKTISIF